MAVSAYDQPKYAQFNPLSMQEIWAPAQILREQHDKAEEALATQSSMGASTLALLDPERDKMAYAVHQDYLNKIRQAQEDLSSKGYVDSGRKKSLWEAKATYENKILPIQSFIQKREEAAKMEDQLLMQDRSYKFAKRARDISVDDAMKNPGLLSPTGVSQYVLQKQVAEKAKDIEKYIEQEAPEYKKTPIAYLVQTMVRSGASINDIMKAGQQNLNADQQKGLVKLLHGMVDSTLSANGVYDMFGNDPKSLSEIWNNAAQGLTAATGTKSMGFQQNQWGMEMAKLAMSQQSQGAERDFMGQETFTPEVTDKKEWDRLESIQKSAKLDINADQRSLGYGHGDYSGMAASERAAQDALYKNRSASQTEVIKMAKKYGMSDQIPDLSKGKVPKDVWDNFVDKVISRRKEELKQANKAYVITDASNANITSVFDAEAITPGTITTMDGKPVDINKYRNKEGKFAFGSGSATMVTKDGIVLKVFDKSGNQEVIKASPESLLDKTEADNVNSSIKFNKEVRNMTPSQFINSNWVKGRTVYNGKSGYIVETPYGDRFIDDAGVSLGLHKLTADWVMLKASESVGDKLRTRNTPVNANPQ